MHSYRARAVPAALALLVLAATLAAHSRAGVELERNVIAGGGGRAASGDRSVHGTVGQAAVAVSAGGSSRVAAGFWPRSAPLPPTATPQIAPSDTPRPATPSPVSPTPTGASSETPPTASATPEPSTHSRYLPVAKRE